MSITIKLPKEPNKEQILAILDAWIDGLERGYTLTITEIESESKR